MTYTILCYDIITAPERPPRLSRSLGRVHGSVASDLRGLLDTCLEYTESALITQALYFITEFPRNHAFEFL